MKKCVSFLFLRQVIPTADTECQQRQQKAALRQNRVFKPCHIRLVNLNVILHFERGAFCVSFFSRHRSVPRNPARPLSSSDPSVNHFSQRDREKFRPRRRKSPKKQISSHPFLSRPRDCSRCASNVSSSNTSALQCVLRCDDCIQSSSAISVFFFE